MNMDDPRTESEKPPISLLRETFSIDPRTLGVFRIALGGILLLDLLLRVRYFGELYVEGGAALLTVRPNLYSLHELSFDPVYQSALFLLAGAFGLMLLLGFWTRLATIGSLVLSVSLLNVWPGMGDYGDYILRALLLWGIFLPLGARFSLDAKRRGGRPPTGLVFSAATVAVQLQFCFVFFFAGISKLGGPEWEMGTAIELTLANSYWSHPFGDWLAQQRGLLRLMTPLVVYFELFGPIAMLLTARTVVGRLLVLAAFWSFQFGLAISLELNVFPLVNFASTIPFLPVWLWRQVDLRLGGKAPTTVITAAEEGRSENVLGLPPAVNVAVTVMLLFTFVLNFHTLGRIHVPIPSWLQTATHHVGMYQTWTMYAPRPPTDDVMLEHEYVPVSGVTLEQADPDGRKRAVFADLEQHYRFKYYVEIALRSRELRPRIGHYLEWICREWNEDVPPERQLAEAALFAHTRSTLAGGGPQAKRIPIGRARCRAPR